MQMRSQHMEMRRLHLSLEAQKGLGISAGSRALLKRWTSIPVILRTFLQR